MQRNQSQWFNIDQNLQEIIYKQQIDYSQENFNYLQLPFTNSILNQLKMVSQNYEQNVESGSSFKQDSRLCLSQIQTIQPQKKIASFEIYQNKFHSNKEKLFHQNQSQIKINAQHVSSNDYQTQNEEQSVESNVNEVQQSYYHQGILKSKFNSQREKKSCKNRTPQIETRNILQYFWKVFRNFFNGKTHLFSLTKSQKNQMKKVWDKMKDLKPSLQSFTLLFKNDLVKPYLKEMFKSRYLMRQIIYSSLKKNRKATYLRYVRVLLKGFIAQNLNFLR